MFWITIWYQFQIFRTRASARCGDLLAHQHNTATVVRHHPADLLKQQVEYSVYIQARVQDHARLAQSFGKITLARCASSMCLCSLTSCNTPCQYRVSFVIADDNRIVSHPDDVSIMGDHPIFHAKWLVSLIAMQMVRHDAVFIVWMYDFQPFIRIGLPFYQRVT